MYYLTQRELSTSAASPGLASRTLREVLRCLRCVLVCPDVYTPAGAPALAALLQALGASHSQPEKVQKKPKR